MEQNSKITYDKSVSGTVETSEWFEGREMEDFCVDCCLQILNVIKHLTCTGFKYSCGTLTCAPSSALGLSVRMHDMKSCFFLFFSKAKSKHHLSENCLDVLMLYFYVPGFKKKRKKKDQKQWCTKH